MPTGACLCGTTKYEFEGKPVIVAACHCIPCRKTSGTSASVNIMVPRSAFKLASDSARPRTWTRKADSGKNVTYHACDTCPTLLYVMAEGMPDLCIVKLGTVEDKEIYEKAHVQHEFYTRNRPPWCEAWFQGAQQVEAQ